jgi:hypothetical protein
VTFHQRYVKSRTTQTQGADSRTSYEERHSPTRTSSAKPTTPLRAPHPLSTRHSAPPPKTTTSSTSSRRHLYYSPQRENPNTDILPNSYTSINNKLYELDGLQPAPILHGPCTPTDFPQKIIPVLQRRIARYPASEIRFNLMACCRDLRIRAREIGDEEELEEQEDKRARWLYENSLRRHNFVGFVGELLKAVTRAKLEAGKGEYDEWVEDAKARTKRKREEMRKMGVIED